MLLYVTLLLLVHTIVHTDAFAAQSRPVNTDHSTAYASSPQAAHSIQDELLSQRWGVSRIEAPQAWQIGEGKRPVIVAVLDTGIDETNQDLAQMVIARVNYTDSPTTEDIYEHGTHMAGTIAAVAPECQLINIKVADDAGICQATVVAEGITEAVNHGANVISISLCIQSSPDLEEAVNYAWNQGAIIVAAAGNEGKSKPIYPAYYNNCMAVAGTDRGNTLALLSNYGDWVDVAAPGYNIYSEMPDNQYGYKSGTSSAVAHVSGVAALVFSVAEDSNGNGLVNDEVRWAMENSCSPIAADGVGRGLINAFRAVELAMA